MRIFLGVGRFVANASLEQENFYTAWVRLWDGHIIKRHKRKHFVDFEFDKTREQITPEVSITKKLGWWHRLVEFIKNFFNPQI